MKAVVGRRFTLIFGLAMFASNGCGGRSGITRSADANSSEPDTNLAAPANDTAGGPEEADSALAIDGIARPADVGADGGDARALSCTQAQRQSAPCPSSEWYAFQGDRRCFLCVSSAAPGCSSTVSYTCTIWGDGLCYLLCQRDSDCTDPCFPFCRKILLYGGNEHCGTSSKSVCLADDRDIC
jgi:hypothetical protein